MLDVIIAYVVILLVLSTLTTAVLQLVQRVFFLRNLWLVRCLGRVYAGTLQVDEETPDENAGDATARKKRARATKTGRAEAKALLATPEANPMGIGQPDYIDGPSVRRWLTDALVQQGLALAENKEPKPSPATAIAEAEAWANARAPWLADGADDRWAKWWTNTEKQMSARFRLYLVGLSVVIGFFLSCETGLEAIGVARHLSESPAEVQALLDDAGRSAGDSRRTGEPEAYLRLVERELRAEFPGDGKDRVRRLQLLVCFDAIGQEAVTESPRLRAAAIELRLRKEPAPTVPASCPLTADKLKTKLLPAVEAAHDTIANGLGFGGYPLSTSPLWLFVGRLLMALFIGLGAPFWFELLGMLRLPLNRKPAEPEEKKPSQ